MLVMVFFSVVFVFGVFRLKVVRFRCCLRLVCVFRLVVCSVVMCFGSSCSVFFVWLRVIRMFRCIESSCVCFVGFVILRVCGRVLSVLCFVLNCVSCIVCLN